jgi:hypothetical protein
MIGHLSFEQKSDIMKDAVSMHGVFQDSDLHSTLKDSILNVQAGGAPAFICKWLHTFAENNEELAVLMFKVFQLLSPSERLSILESLWTGKFFDNNNQPMFQEFDGESKYLLLIPKRMNNVTNSIYQSYYKQGNVRVHSQKS